MSGPQPILFSEIERAAKRTPIPLCLRDEFTRHMESLDDEYLELKGKQG
jgi:hypothetical protein